MLVISAVPLSPVTVAPESTVLERRLGRLEVIVVVLRRIAGHRELHARHRLFLVEEKEHVDAMFTEGFPAKGITCSRGPLLVRVVRVAERRLPVNRLPDETRSGIPPKRYASAEPLRLSSVAIARMEDPGIGALLTRNRPQRSITTSSAAARLPHPGWSRTEAHRKE